MQALLSRQREALSLVTHYATLDIEALLAPLDARQPAPAISMKDETFKPSTTGNDPGLGGLQRHAWIGCVDEAARQYLGGQCKHFRWPGARYGPPES